jgi:hypothetical protein
MCWCASAEAVVVVRLAVLLFVISSPWSTGGSVVLNLGWLSEVPATEERVGVASPMSTVVITVQW